MSRRKKRVSREWSPEEIKWLRKSLTLTQKQFAEKLGVHVVTIIRWESGSFRPSKMAMVALNNLDK